MPTIKLRNGSGVPSNGTLAAGEPAIDLTNRKLYSSTNGTDVVEISPNTDSGGTVTSVDSGTGLTGGPITTSGTLALATAGAGAGTYGSTSDGTKIDQITLDAYGRVTAITTGSTGSSSTTGTVTSVSGGDGLTGSVTTSGSLAVGAGAGMHVNADDVALYSSVNAGGSTTLADEQFRTVTSSGQTITLPSSPAAGDTVYISVGNFTNTTVARNGSNISGLAENMTIDVANIGITLVYSGDATQGWRLM